MLDHSIAAFENHRSFGKEMLQLRRNAALLFSAKSALNWKQPKFFKPNDTFGTISH
jgi:hypothetical protein